MFLELGFYDVFFKFVIYTLILLRFFFQDLFIFHYFLFK